MHALHALAAVDQLDRGIEQRELVTHRDGVAVIASEPLDESDRWDEIRERELIVLEPHAIACAA